MRRFLSVGLIALGAFLIVAALLMRFYAYPQLAVAPIDQNSVTNLSASDATLLDVGSLEEITTDLEIESRTVSDQEASEAASEEAGEEIRVWVNTSSIRSEDGQVRSRSTERAAFDAVTGMAVPCDDCFRETTQGEREEIEFEGLIYKFPFDTQKEDYPFWDSSLRDTATATYTGTDTVEGLDVYVFQMVVPATVIGTREVPGSLFDDDSPAVDADINYEITRTFYVEPNTGAVVDRADDTRNWLSYDGAEVTATEAVISYTDDQVSETAGDVETQAMLLGGMRGLYPLLAGLVGLVLLALGIVLMLTDRSRRPRG